MIKKLQGKVGAVAVRHGGHALKLVAETLLKFLLFAALAMEDQRKIHGLGYPRPVKPPVAIAAGFVKAHYGRLHDILLDFFNARSCGPFGFVNPIDH